MRELRRGRIRLPLPRAGLKWKREDALALFDSIYRGYPIGGFLLWETPAPPDSLELGQLRIALAGRDDAWWVVDGQQRLAVMARVLLSDPSDEEPLALSFDPDRQLLSAHPPPKAEGDSGKWLPLSEILNPERLSQWTASIPDEHKERRAEALRFAELIGDYPIPTHIVRSADDSAVREMFGRLSTAGHPMTESQVHDALLGARGSRKGLTIAEVASELEETGFGRLENEQLVRLLELVRGEDRPRGSAERRWNPHDSGSTQDYQALLTLAGEVIAFLQRHAGIPRIELLPWTGALIELGRFFRDHPEPQARTRELLSRWFWRTQLGSRTTRSKGSDLAPPPHSSGSEHAAIQRLLDGTIEKPLPQFDKIHFDLRFGDSRRLMLALLDLQPRHLVTDRLVKAQDLLGRNGRLQIPKCIPGSPRGPYADTAINRLAHPANSKPGRRLQGGWHSQKTLASHGISKEAEALLHQGNFEGFLALRASTLNLHLDAFFGRKTRWAETDRPPLSALIID